MLLIRDGKRLPATAVWYKVALAQACELIHCSSPDSPDYKCAVTMGQSGAGGRGCTVPTLQQAEGKKKEEAGCKEGIRVIWLVLKHRISRTVWKATW